MPNELQQQQQQQQLIRAAECAMKRTVLSLLSDTSVHWSSGSSSATGKLPGLSGKRRPRKEQQKRRRRNTWASAAQASTVESISSNSSSNSSSLLLTFRCTLFTFPFIHCFLCPLSLKVVPETSSKEIEGKCVLFYLWSAAAAAHLATSRPHSLILTRCRS